MSTTQYVTLCVCVAVHCPGRVYSSGQVLEPEGQAGRVVAGSAAGCGPRGASGATGSPRHESHQCYHRGGESVGRTAEALLPVGL